MIGDVLFEEMIDKVNRDSLLLVFRLDEKMFKSLSFDFAIMLFSPACKKLTSMLLNKERYKRSVFV